MSRPNRVAAAPLLALLCLSGGAEAGEAKNGQVFDNWTVRCETPEGMEREQCLIFQMVVLRQGGQRVLHIAVGYVPTSDLPIAILTLPLGISLPPGASLQVGDGDPVRFPVERCEPKGCKAGLKLSQSLLTKLRQGEAAQVTFHDGERHPVNVSLSLKGFATGLDAVR